MKFYKTTNLWENYRQEFPVISRIPFIGYWGFGLYTRGYFDQKLPMREGEA